MTAGQKTEARIIQGDWYYGCKKNLAGPYLARWLQAKAGVR